MDVVNAFPGRTVGVPYTNYIVSYCRFYSNHDVKKQKSPKHVNMKSMSTFILEQAHFHRY